MWADEDGWLRDAPIRQLSIQDSAAAITVIDHVGNSTAERHSAGPLVRRLSDSGEYCRTRESTWKITVILTSSSCYNEVILASSCYDEAVFCCNEAVIWKITPGSPAIRHGRSAYPSRRCFSSHQASPVRAAEMLTRDDRADTLFDKERRRADKK